MSDTITTATGLFIDASGTTAYLYDRNGTFIADHRLAADVTDVIQARRTAEAVRAQAVNWAAGMGYRVVGEGLEHNGYMVGVEHVGVPDPEEPANVDGPPPLPARGPRTTCAQRVHDRATHYGWVDQWHPDRDNMTSRKYVHGEHTLYVDLERGGRRIAEATLYSGGEATRVVSSIAPWTPAKFATVSTWFATYGTLPPVPTS